jgi:hypothetical protein
MTDIISRLPPEMMKKSGRQATVIFRDGTEEKLYHLARRGNYHIVSREPYAAVRRYRDIELIAGSEIERIVFAE